MLFVRKTAFKKIGSCILLTLTFGCGQDLKHSPPKENFSQPVTVRLDWLITGHSLPLVVAKEKGFYNQYGINVVLSEGRGDLLTCELVSNGQETIGLADASTGALAISKGAAIKYIAVFVQKTPSSIIFYPEKKIKKPEDLKGKRGGVSSAGATTALLKAVLAQHNISANQLSLTTMAPRSKRDALLGKKFKLFRGRSFLKLPLFFSSIKSKNQK